MPKLFVDANPRMVAYVLENGGSGYQLLQSHHTSMEAEYLAVIYGLNEYYMKWSRELDPRYGEVDIERMKRTGEIVLENVASPADQTVRPLPPPVMVCSDNEVVVKQLCREYHIQNNRLRRLAQQVWQQTQNVDVKFAWVPRAENLAGKMLK